MSTLLESRGKAATKGVIPVLALPTLTGAGWDQLKEARYETYDHLVSAEGITLKDNGSVKLKGVKGDFRLTPFSATGFAWCSGLLGEDRKLEEDEAAMMVTDGFKTQGTKQYRMRVTEGGTITSILSPSYHAVKNSELVDDLLRLQDGMDACSMFYLSPYKTAIALQSKRKFKYGKEDLRAGILWKNGEDGKHQLSAIGRLIQFICGNGVIVGVGISVHEQRMHSTRGSMDWTDYNVGGKTMEIINNVVGTQSLLEHLDTFSLAKEKVKEDTFRRVIQMGGLGPQQAQKLPVAYNRQRGLRPDRKGETMYDMFNAVTGMKDEFPKSKLTWEELGGELMLDPKKFMAVQN